MKIYIMYINISNINLFIIIIYYYYNLIYLDI